jgi:hypothetical protein
VVRFGQELDSLLMQTLVTVFNQKVPHVLGFDSLEHYGRERLGMSATCMWGLLRLGKALRLSPDVRQAYQVGEVSKSQAEEVLRVATPATVTQWIEYASKKTVQKLRSVVRTALALRKEEPQRYADLLPPEDVPIQDVQALAFLDQMGAVQQDCPSEGRPHAEQPFGGLPTCAGPTQDDSCPGGVPARRGLDTEACAPAELPICAAPPAAILRVPEVRYLQACPQPRRLRVWVPEDLDDFFEDSLHLCRIWLGRPASTGNCIELMVANFLAQYAPEVRQAVKDHPVLERDGWTCTAPGCSRMAMLQEHHLRYRSHGGSNDHPNLSTLCAFHHLKCLHEARMAAVGTAPDNIVWAMGIRPDGKPTEVVANETRITMGA